MILFFGILLLVILGGPPLAIRRSVRAADAFGGIPAGRHMPPGLFFRVKLVFLLCLMGMPSCRSPAASDTSSAHTHAIEEFVNMVDVVVLEEKSFHKELLSNGRLRALRRSRLSFPFSKPLQELHVINGQYVEEGQLLATLCDEELIRRLESASIRKKQARLEMEYLLLGYGFSLSDSLMIPSHIREIAGIASGYREASQQVRNLERDLERSRLKAPFGGLVTGLDARPYEWVQAGQALCTLIDPAVFLVEFPIMEQEYPRLETGSPVRIIPFAQRGRSGRGHVHSIEPRVNENGQIRVTAWITDTEGLLEGMNVRVHLLHEVPGQMVVPRSAVLYRDQQEVLFRYEEGRAMWTYVQVLHENSSQYSVVARPDGLARLAAGDTVITDGHLNLVHRSEVKIRRDVSFSHQ